MFIKHYGFYMAATDRWHGTKIIFCLAYFNQNLIMIYTLKYRGFKTRLHFRVLLFRSASVDQSASGKNEKHNQLTHQSGCKSAEAADDSSNKLRY